MEPGDSVRVKSTGQTGTAEWINGERVMVEVPITLRNGKPGRLHIEHAAWNLEVVNNREEGQKATPAPITSWSR